MRSGGARRGKANGGFGVGGHFGLGSFGKHHVSTRPLGNSEQALNGAERFCTPRGFLFVQHSDDRRLLDLLIGLRSAVALIIEL